MRTAELLAKLGSKDIKVWAEGDRLRYDAPQGALTPDLREELVNRKAEILALLHRADTPTSSAALPLTPVSRDRPLALSFAQQRLWFLDQLEPAQSAFNMAWSFRLTGGLEVAALDQALSAIVDRHEVLRTTFADGEDAVPVQVIAPAGVLVLEQVELASLDPAERDAELQRQMGKRANRPFVLAKGPVLRATLYRLAPTDHVLALTIHHIAFDGWSFGVLARELAAFYTAFVEGREPALPELSMQYADYAAWQRQWLRGDVLKAQLDYWRRQLGPELPVLELPTDHPRPAQQSFAGARDNYALSESLLASLRSLSQREGVTPFMTLATGLKVLFHRYSGQSVITIGTPVANRTHSELEPLIGFFVNSLVLSTELESELSFREALARVREVSLGAYAHQDLPFEQLVEALKPQRDLSRHPLFQVIFTLQNVPFEAMELPGLQLSAMPVERPSSQFDLTLLAREYDGGLRLNVEYNTDLFERETIRRLLAHFETLLTAAVADPEQAISRLPLLSEAERRQLLVDWNTTRVEGPERCIHELVESQAARTPDAIAVAFEEQRLTYHDLNSRANQLAHYLRGFGIGPGARVGVFMHRSHEVLVGLLGVLKAGGAYVLLDPAYPAERLAFMADDSGVRVLLTQRSLLETLPSCQAEVVCLDSDWETISQAKPNTPVCEVSADHLAFVVYSSGSTGKPKGVALCHRTLTNLIEWQAKAQHSPRDSTTLQFASLSFDVASQEIFSTLATGGRLLMIPESTRADFLLLLDVLDRHEVQRVFLPFVALQQLANFAEEHGRSLPALQEIITAGEQLKISESIGRFMSGRPDGILVNQYGPSESHVVSSYNLSGSPEDWPTLPPIGRPIDSTQLYVLDARLEPVPIGVMGELYIGGTGLARGYLNRPAMTAEKFVPHPFSADPGARLYKTGDQARYRPDGNLEFLGRRDHQVKLRGYRVELGEIEAVLAGHPAVHEAVTLVREETLEDQRLVAYVVSPQGVTPSDLRQHLKQKLPEYMVPAHFVMLDAFPLTPSGKVDRKALPIPDESRTLLETAFVAPRTPTEGQLAKIWQEVLKLDKVGTQDNFFELGGHSLLATQVLSRVRRALDVDVPLRAFFENPTVAGLAEVVAHLETVPGRSSAIALILEKIGAMDAGEIHDLLNEKKKKTGL